jgi:hypothetical protein
MAKKKMKLPINEVLGVVAGAVAAGFVSKLVNDKMPNTPGYIKALIPIGAGIFLTGNKNAIIKGAGFGMVAKGGAELAGTLIPGIGNIDEVFLSAPADQSILSLPADQSVLSGDDDFINGDDEFMNGDDEFMNGEEDFMGQMEEVEI